MTEEAQAAPKAKATCNIQINKMGNRYATGGVNIVAGWRGKLLAGEVCEVPKAVADVFKDSDLISGTNAKASCKLVGNEIERPKQDEA